MPKPAGAMDTSSVWEGQEAKTWTELTEKALGSVCDKHNKDQGTYVEPKTSTELKTEVPLKTKEEALEPLHVENHGPGFDLKFTPELKQEFIEIILENKMKLLEVTDECIRFEYNKKEFIIVPYE